MAPDNLFGSSDEISDDNKENSNITDKHPAAGNEQLEKEKDFKASMSNGKEANDPSAARYTGAQGYTQRNDQKDQLENLHIGGSDIEPYGANDRSEQGQGPGFDAEGSVELDHQLRTRDQEFGEKTTSGPAKPVED